MAAPKAQTLQQRFGFMDNDLKSPAHDEMMLWLDKNAIRIIEELGLYEPSWDANSGWSKIKDEAKQAVTYAIKFQNLTDRYSSAEIAAWYECIDDYNTTPAYIDISESAKVKWEVVVKKQDYRSEYIIGFIDLAVYFNQYHLCVSGIEWKSQPRPGRWELTEKRLPDWDTKYYQQAVYFEVKSTIPSLGELIRQINTYREYVKSPFVIVSPDDRFIEPLKSQGIRFYKYQ